MDLLHHETGTGSDFGDYLVLCFLIGFGTALVVWLMCLPMAERQLIVDRTLNVLILLLAQPGLYLSDWFATRRKCAWPDRVALSLATLFGLVILLPAYVSTWLTPVLNLY